MPSRRLARAAAGPRITAARPRSRAAGAWLLAVALLAASILFSAGTADAAVTGGAAVPSGSASQERPGGDRGLAGSPSTGSGGSTRSRHSGGVGVPPPGSRRSDPGDGDRAADDRDAKDDRKDDRGRDGRDGDGRDRKGRDGKGDKDRDGKGDRRGDEDRSSRDEPRSDRDDDRPGPGAADIPSVYLALYRAAGAASDVSWRLVAAVGKNESDHGRSKLPGVRSGVNGAGCCSGPMQICTVKSCGNTWDAYRRDGNGDGTSSVYDAADSIHAAAALLGELQRLFGKHPAHILAGYNAGPGAVQRHKGVPPYRETEAYVKRGLDYMRTLR